MKTKLSFVKRITQKEREFKIHASTKLGRLRLEKRARRLGLKVEDLVK